MADEPTNDNTKQARFWVEHLPVNDSYVALLGDKLETASRIPLRHPEIPALGKKRNVATPMEQQYGHERWEQLPKEQTLFSTLEEIDATLEKSDLWRDPETNDIVSIENRPRPTEQATVPETSSERLIKLRQAAENIELPEEVASAEAPPTTPLAPRPNLPAVVPKQDRAGKFVRGIGSLVGKRLPLVRLAQAARQGWELLPEETQADARNLFSSMNEPDPFGLELGLPEEEIVAKIDELGEGAWGWLERRFGAGERIRRLLATSWRPAWVHQI